MNFQNSSHDIASQLPNYLRAHRKRLALSQQEVAYLLGVGSAAKVCRHERFVRIPELETVLAYEAIFQKPLRELFVGMHQRVAREVANRARALLSRAGKGQLTKRATRKREVLESIARITNPK